MKTNGCRSPVIRAGSIGIFSACRNHSEIFFYVHFVCHKTIIYKIRASSCSCWSQWVFLQLLFNSSRIDDWNWAAAERLVLKQNCGQKSKVTLSSWHAESTTFIFFSVTSRPNLLSLQVKHFSLTSRTAKSASVWRIKAVTSASVCRKIQHLELGWHGTDAWLDPACLPMPVLGLEGKSCCKKNIFVRTANRHGLQR